MAVARHPHEHERIIRDPAIMGDKPVIAGTRIPVERVLALLAHKPDVGALFAAYPELTMDDVKACLAYAHALVERKQTRKKAASAEHRPTSV